MLRIVMKSKIHSATITDVELEYEGSIAIDSGLLKEADIFPGEKVQIVNSNNGARFETYVIEGEAGTGIISLRGAAARCAYIGDKVTIICYCLAETKEAATLRKKIIIVDKNNKPVKK